MSKPVPGGSLRGSTTSTIGQPSRSIVRAGADRRAGDASRLDRRGRGSTSVSGRACARGPARPRRRVRSTSGPAPPCSASSPSSSTMIRGEVGDRAPTPRCGRRPRRSRPSRLAAHAAVRAASDSVCSELEHPRPVALEPLRERAEPVRVGHDHDASIRRRRAARRPARAGRRRAATRASCARSARCRADGEQVQLAAGRLPGRTALGGDAARSSDTAGPAQRQAAQSQSATTSGGGPARRNLGEWPQPLARRSRARRRRRPPSRAPAGRAAGPARSCRRAPRRHRVGHEVVERPVDRGHVRPHPAHPGALARSRRRSWLPAVGC